MWSNMTSLYLGEDINHKLGRSESRLVVNWKKILFLTLRISPRTHTDSHTCLAYEIYLAKKWKCLQNFLISILRSGTGGFFIATAYIALFKNEAKDCAAEMFSVTGKQRDIFMQIDPAEKGQHVRNNPWVAALYFGPCTLHAFIDIREGVGCWETEILLLLGVHLPYVEPRGLNRSPVGRGPSSTELPIVY